jgi:hypothetical protein
MAPIPHTGPLDEERALADILLDCMVDAQTRAREAKTMTLQAIAEIDQVWALYPWLPCLYPRYLRQAKIPSPTMTLLWPFGSPMHTCGMQADTWRTKSWKCGGGSSPHGDRSVTACRAYSRASWKESARRCSWPTAACTRRCGIFLARRFADGPCTLFLRSNEETGPALSLPFQYARELCNHKAESSGGSVGNRL